MPHYRRNRVLGGTYFFTVNLHNRHQSLLIDHIGALRQAIRDTKRRKPFRIDAWVVLPEHMHCIWTLPSGDDDYSSRWREIKKSFSKAIPNTEPRSIKREYRNERGIWQHRFWEHTIRDDVDLQRHLDYLHFNPVKHGLVAQVKDWQYSSFHQCVKQGMYEASWGKNVDVNIDVGERK